MELFLAIFLGGLFGFALNRVGATNPENIINMLRLTDVRLMKAILFAIGFASTLLFIGLSFGLIDAGHLSVKASYIGVVVGGALLGIGFAIAGYCPGTGLAAAATGRRDAFVFTLGGLVGAFVFTLVYGWLKANTSLFQSIAGGDVMLIQTANEKYTALLSIGEIGGIIIGVLFMAIALALPNKLRK